MPFSTEQIWSVLADLRESPRWWPDSVRLKVLKASPDLIGSEMEVRPRGGRSFQCHVAALDPPRRMAMRYPGSFIVGTGEWRLESLSASRTRVKYAIDVVANGWLAAILGRLMSFDRLHSQAMQDILAALERETARRGGHASPD